MRYLVLAILAALTLLAPTPAAAQATAYAADGRPEFCLLSDIAHNRQAADELIGMTLDNLGYSRYRGAGQQVMETSQRAVGWLFYLSSNDTVHWRGTESASRDLEDMVTWIITDRNGVVPTLAQRNMPAFNRATAGCRSTGRN